MVAGRRKEGECKMARHTGSKCRLCRREGVKLFLKGDRCFSLKCPIDKKGAVIPGEHGRRRSKRPSAYGLQLREKQKLKRSYGILEEQLRGYYKEAKKAKGATGELLLRCLESRLDNVVYRLGLTVGRSIARQLVSHGHVLVNGKKIDIPSYRVKVGDTITLASKSFNIPVVKKSLEKEASVPAWLIRKAGVGKVDRLPNRDEVDFAVDESLIVEFYSR